MCKLDWYPKLYKHIILLVGTKTFIEFLLVGSKIEVSKPIIFINWECMYICFIRVYPCTNYIYLSVTHMRASLLIIPLVGSGILRDKTMDDELVYIPNDDKQNHNIE